MTRSVPWYSILFARSIASRRFSTLSASSSASICWRSASSASSLAFRCFSFAARAASIVFGHFALRSSESFCRRSRSSRRWCASPVSPPFDFARNPMFDSSWAPMTVTPLRTDAGIERDILTAVSFGVPKSDSSTKVGRVYRGR